MDDSVPGSFCWTLRLVSLARNECLGLGVRLRERQTASTTMVKAALKQRRRMARIKTATS